MNEITHYSTKEGWHPFPHQMLFMQDYGKWGPRGPNPYTGANDWCEHLGTKRNLLITGRQHGKDEMMQWIISQHMFYQPGSKGFYSFPLQTTIRKIVGRGGRLFRLIDKGIVKFYSQDNLFEHINGSQAYLFGSDQWEAMLGYTWDYGKQSEWQSAKEIMWTYVEPALKNRAPMSFNGTPRGPGNQLLQMRDTWLEEMAEMEQEINKIYSLTIPTRKVLPNGEVKTENITRTFDEPLVQSNGYFHITKIGNQHTGLKEPHRIRLKFLERKKKLGTRPARILCEQEYFVSEEGGLADAVYPEETAFIEKQITLEDGTKTRNRIRDLFYWEGEQKKPFPHPLYPIHSAWDIAKKKQSKSLGSPFVVVVFQIIPNAQGIPQIYIFDYFMDRRVSHKWIIDEWLVKSGYTRKAINGKENFCILPHDWSSAQTLVDNPEEWFLDKGMTVYHLNVEDYITGISRTRDWLNSGNMWFDTKMTQPSRMSSIQKTFWEAIKAYQWQWDDNIDDYKKYKTWADDCADALRYVPDGLVELPTLLKIEPQDQLIYDDGLKTKYNNLIKPNTNELIDISVY